MSECGLLSVSLRDQGPRTIWFRTWPMSRRCHLTRDRGHDSSAPVSWRSTYTQLEERAPRAGDRNMVGMRMTPRRKLIRGWTHPLGEEVVR